MLGCRRKGRLRAAYVDRLDNNDNGTGTAFYS